MYVTLRKRYADGLQFDVNYTLSKSEGHGIAGRTRQRLRQFRNGGYSGFLVNSFDPESNYGTSDFDLRHQVNANWLVDLPFGQGRRFGAKRWAACSTS